MQAVCEFSSSGWLGEVRVPTAVVVTTQDRIVPPDRRPRQDQRGNQFGSGAGEFRSDLRALRVREDVGMPQAERVWPENMTSLGGR